MKDISTAVGELLNKVQSTSAVHKKCVLDARKLRDQVGMDQFVDALLKHVFQVLVVFKRSPPIERVVSFVIALVGDAGDGGNVERDDPLAVNLIERLLPFHGAKDKAVRFRVCQFTSGLLNSLGEDAEVSEDVFDEIEDVMMQRVRDAVPSVRAQAVHALSRLQDPEDEEDEVVQEFLRMLETDPSKDVRKAVLTCIGVSEFTIGHVMARTRDVAEDVRRHAFTAVSFKMELRSLSIAQRTRLLRDGLHDRSAVVRDACTDLLCKNWLKKKNNDPVRLLEALDVETYEEEADAAVRVLMRHIWSEYKKVWIEKMNEWLGDMSKLTAERALLFRASVELVLDTSSSSRADKSMKNDALDAMLPSVTAFCSIIAAYMNVSKSNSVSTTDALPTGTLFVVKALLAIAKRLDYSDEAGRQVMHQLIKGILSDFRVSSEVTAAAVAVFVAVEPDVNVQAKIVAECVEQMNASVEAKRGPLDELVSVVAKLETEAFEAKKKYANANAALDEDEEDDEVNALKNAYERIEAEYKEKSQKLTQLAASVEIIEVHMLHLIAELCSVTALSPSHSLIASFKPYLQTAIMHSSPVIIEAAVRALGIFSLLDTHSAAEHAPSLVPLLVSEDEGAGEGDGQESIQVVAAKTLFDLAHVFGVGVLGEGENAANTLDVLLGTMDSDSRLVREVGVEGCAKLMFGGVVGGAKLLTRLLLMYFNPLTQDDARVRQCLSVFFPAFSFKNADNQRVIAAALLPCFRVLDDAPADSPLSSVSHMDVARYIVYLSEGEYDTPSNGEGEGEASVDTPHDALARQLLREIIADPLTEGALRASKVVALLSLPNANTDTNAEAGKNKNAAVLHLLASDALDAVEDEYSSSSGMNITPAKIRTLENGLKKYIVTLAALIGKKGKGKGKNENDSTSVSVSHGLSKEERSAVHSDTRVYLKARRSAMGNDGVESGGEDEREREGDVVPTSPGKRGYRLRTRGKPARVTRSQAKGKTKANRRLIDDLDDSEDENEGSGSDGDGEDEGVGSGSQETIAADVIVGSGVLDEGEEEEEEEEEELDSSDERVEEEEENDESE